MQVRRRLSILERPISTASRARRTWYGYSAYHPETIVAHEAKRVEQFEAHLVRTRRCLLGKRNREYPSHSWPHEPPL
jgi:hypothetical protein